MSMSYGREKVRRIRKKQKYKQRADGRKYTSRTYKGDEGFNLAHYCGRKCFYGKDDKEVDKNIELFEKSLSGHSRAKNMEDLIGEWWDDKKPKLSPNSIGSYRAKMNEIIDRFGSIPVDELTASQILAWLNWVASKGMSQRSVSDRRSVMKNILDYALAKELIESNPCSSLPIVKGAGKKKRKPASDPDVQALEEHKEDSLLTRLIYFLEYTGCRIGEAIVMQEKDIDREHHKAQISKDVGWIGNVPSVKEWPKTDAGIREIDLYDNVLEILPEYSEPETYIFFPDGLPHRSALQKKLVKLRKDLGMTSTAHQFRHTYAGIMHSAEIDVKDASARMGHANVAITQDIYTEIEKQHNEKIRNKANDYIMNERLGRNKKCCPKCGSTYTRAEDGHEFSYCPDCGKKICK